MIIALDLVGGDKAPKAVITAIKIATAREFISPDQLIAIGTREALHSFKRLHWPTFRKVGRLECSSEPNASIKLGLAGIKNKEFDAFVSAGDTKAMVMHNSIINNSNRP